MGHTLRDDELAIVIRPNNYEEDWDGDCSIELVSSPDNPVPNIVMAHIMNVADLVEEHRNYLMGIDDEAEEELKVTREGNVYTLNTWTKTKGNA